MGNKWTETYLIHSNDIDYKSETRLSVLLSLAQRTADADLEQLGATREQMIEAGMGWMLMTMDLRIGRMPKALEEIKIETWNKGPKGALWQRDFRIYAGGEIIAEACSIWALVDIQKRRMLRPSKFPFDVYINEEDSAGEAPDKVAIPEDIALQDAYRAVVRYSGIDANLHLNNARYADLCMDTLTKDELAGLACAGFRITYHHEARLGDEIQVKRSEVVDGRLYVSGQAADGTHYFDAYLLLKETDRSDG
ncbi:MULTISPECIES: acyl-[acyl-carrier-protein] thioesterase [Paenibacillus]|nr:MULTISPECIES: acyl-ACP thioesterase domain-containing protein [Paenibacillus]